jgi:hypothetical protein
MLRTFVIKTDQAFIKNFNGQHATRDDENFVSGASGTTKQYGLTVGGALYLADDEVVQDKK